MVSLYLELCKCDWRSSSGEHFGPHKAMAAGNSDEEGREEGGMGEERKGRETQITSNVLSGFPALGGEQ